MRLFLAFGTAPFISWFWLWDKSRFLNILNVTPNENVLLVVTDLKHQSSTHQWTNLLRINYKGTAVCANVIRKDTYRGYGELLD